MNPPDFLAFYPPFLQVSSACDRCGHASQFPYKNFSLNYVWVHDTTQCAGGCNFYTSTLPDNTSPNNDLVGDLVVFHLGRNLADFVISPNILTGWFGEQSEFVASTCARVIHYFHDGPESGLRTNKTTFPFHCCQES